MAHLLSKDGHLVSSDSHLASGGCACCEPHEVGTCDGVSFVFPKTITLIVAGVAANSGINVPGGWVALGIAISDCGPTTNGWTFPDGSPTPGHAIGFYDPGENPCNPPSPARVTTPGEMCSCVNGTWLIWDADDCASDTGTSECFHVFNWNYCGADIIPANNPHQYAANVGNFRLRSSGGVRYISVNLQTGTGLPAGGSDTYTNLAAGGLSIVGGVAQTVGTHVLSSTSPNESGCDMPSTVTVVIT